MVMTETLNKSKILAVLYQIKDEVQQTKEYLGLVDKSKIPVYERYVIKNIDEHLFYTMILINKLITKLETG